MPGWLVSFALAAAVTVVLLVAGSPEAVAVLGLLFGWFLVLALLGLLAETAAQRLGGRWRRFCHRHRASGTGQP